MLCGGGFLWLDVAGGGVGVVGVAACCSGVVDFPTTYWHIRTSGAALCLQGILPPRTILTPRTFCPRIAPAIARWIQTVAVYIMAEWRDALACACGLIEHAIGTAGGGDVADEAFYLADDDARVGGAEEQWKKSSHDG